MDISSVTEKGQATIPAAIRARLGLKKGDKVLFTVKKGGVILTKARIRSKPKKKLSKLTLVEQCLAEEWLSREDEEAFKNL